MNLAQYAKEKFSQLPFRRQASGKVSTESHKITKDEDCPGCFPSLFYAKYPNAPHVTICLCVFRPASGPSFDYKSVMRSEGHTCLDDVNHVRFDPKQSKWVELKSFTCKPCLKRKSKITLPPYKPMPPGTRFR